MKAASFIALIALAVLCLPHNAAAFCGFYVAKADAGLFNDASRVVIARNDGKSVITMVNDYRGEPSEFAMVIPVPSVLQRGQIHLTERSVTDHLDAYTAPRLVEYFDENPCAPARNYMFKAAPMAMQEDAAAGSAEQRAAVLGVKIEAQYAVGEYDVTILSGTQSQGLLTWLRGEGYRIPDRAEKIVSSYIKQGMFFFLAKINLDRQEKEGGVFLRPLQIAFESPKFGLPIRLGTVNADGMQDLVVYTLTEKGRVEPANYRMVPVPSEKELPAFVKEEFGSVYKDVFDTAAKREDYRAFFLEHAWNMSWCDPCAADPLTPEELRELGAFWVSPSAKQAASGGRFIAPGGEPPQVYVTRMHVRYDAERFPEDVRFQETQNQENFQGRYILRHPWTGDMPCQDAKPYRAEVERRRHEEARTLASLTGRSIEDIRKKTAEIYPDFDPNTADDRPWYEKLWSDSPFAAPEKK